MRLRFLSSRLVKLSSEFGILHLSAGELLRAERNNKNSKEGKLIDECLSEGKIVPVEVSLNLIKKAIVGSNHNRYLVDGFPRNFDNLEGWNSVMTGITKVEKVIFIDCDEKELEIRLVNRGKTSGRSDDNLITARKRFTTFQEATMPVINYFTDDLSSSDNVAGYVNSGKNLLVSVDGCKNVNDVYTELHAVVFDCIEDELIDLTREFVAKNYAESEMRDLKVRIGEKGVSANVEFYLIENNITTKKILVWKLVNNKWGAEIQS